MTEQEAIELLGSFYEMDEMYDAAQTAIKALEEIQQYREIGTVDECRAAMEKQKEIRNKAIDDFKAEVKNIIINSSVLRVNDIEEIAEQLRMVTENDRAGSDRTIG